MMIFYECFNNCAIYRETKYSLQLLSRLFCRRFVVVAVTGQLTSYFINTNGVISYFCMELTALKYYSDKMFL